MRCWWRSRWNYSVEIAAAQEEECRDLENMVNDGERLGVGEVGLLYRIFSERDMRVVAVRT